MGKVLRFVNAADIRRAAHTLDDPAELKAILLIVADQIDQQGFVDPDTFKELLRQIEELRSTRGSAPSCVTDLF